MILTQAQKQKWKVLGLEIKKKQEEISREGVEADSTFLSSKDNDNSIEDATPVIGVTYSYYKNQ